MADNCGKGWVAEWFKAAVLKTAVTAWRDTLNPSLNSLYSRLYRSRNGRKARSFAPPMSSRSSAQFVRESFRRARGVRYA